MPYLDRPLILRILERLAFAMDEIILSTSHTEDYAFHDLQTYPNLLPDCGAVDGLYNLLNTAQGLAVAAIACDMPSASATFFKYEREIISKIGTDVVIPSTPKGLEPLHTVYRRGTCLPVIYSALEAG